MRRDWTSQQRAEARILQSLGVPVEYHEYPSSLVLVRQQDSEVENCVFDLPCSGTGIRISLAITSRVPYLSILDIDLALPWESPPPNWLQDPAETGDEGREYRFPGDAIGFTKDIVINEYISLKRGITYGYSIAGLLLGTQHVDIPEAFRHGKCIPATLIILDQFGEEHPAKLDLWVEREKRQRKSKRVPLFPEEEQEVADKQASIPRKAQTKSHDFRGEPSRIR